MARGPFAEWLAQAGLSIVGSGHPGDPSASPIVWHPQREAAEAREAPGAHSAPDAA